MYASTFFDYASANMQCRTGIPQRLRRAIQANDLPLVQRILRSYPSYVQNADVEDKSNTSLHIAARLGLYEIAEFIVTFAHTQDEERSSPHFYTSGLINVGLTYNTEGQTPLHLAAAYSHARIADLLCTNFPRSVGKRDKEGRTALHLASQAQPNKPNKPTNSAFAGNSRSQEDTSTLQVLISYGAEVRAVDVVGSTCLHYASAWGNLKAIRFLIQAGADPLCRNNDGWMPEYYSVTVQAEVYYRNLVAEFEKRKAEDGMRAKERRTQARGGGVRLVSDEDGDIDPNFDDGRDRADSGSSRMTTTTEGGLGISVGKAESWD